MQKADSQKTSTCILTGITLMILILTISSATPAAYAADKNEKPAFAFAFDYTMDEVLNNPDRAKEFIDEYLKWESRFFKIARNPENGITYDGYDLDPKTGMPVDKRYWSAPSKECLDVALCALAINGNEYAKKVVNYKNPDRAPQMALDILRKKLKSYNEWNRRYPGYGGYMPWFYNKGEIVPAIDWIGDAPGLDNGEWVWSMLTAEYILRKNGHTKLADGYAKYNRLLQSNAVKMFYDREMKKVRADVHIVDPGSAATEYKTVFQKPGRCSFLTGEHGVHEGVMMVLYVTLFGKDLTREDVAAIWKDIKMKSVHHKYGDTWQGYWGSAHESWAYLFLPLRKIPQYEKLFKIREIIRSRNAAQRGYPGFATSANRPGGGGYMSAAGIENVGSQKITNNHTYAVYGVFPMLLEFSDNNYNKNYALAWLLNMLKANKMQGPLGGGEAATNDGAKVAYAKTIDGAFPNVIALAGGLEDQTAQMLKKQGKYDRFVKIMTGEYKEAFGDKEPKSRFGFAKPKKQVPKTSLGHFDKFAKIIEIDKPRPVYFSGREYLRHFQLKKIRFPFDKFYKKGISLDGKWKIISYFDNNGKEIKGYKKGRSTINVPGHWIAQGYFDTTGMRLQKIINVKNKEKGKRHILHFGGSIYYTTVKVNGETLKTLKGHKTHEGYFEPFEYDVTDKLRFDRPNVIEILVRNPNEKPDNDLTTKNGGTGFPIWGANKRDLLGVLDFHDTKPGVNIHQEFNVGGVWQPIRIFTVDERASIRGVPMMNTTLLEQDKISYDRRDAQLNFNIPVYNFTSKPQKAKVVATLSPGDFRAMKSDSRAFEKRVVLKPGRNDVQLAGVFKDAKLWWPWFLGMPNCYDADFTVTVNHRVIDTRKKIVGIREMKGRIHGKWLINGRLVRIMGDNVIPSLIPGTYTKHDAIRDGRIVINTNVQLVRVHAHTPHPYFLEMTDQMGILVWQDFPQQWVSQWNDEYRNALLRQVIPFGRMMITHPSVVLLNIHNENKCFSENHFGLPMPRRGTWMHASKPSEDIDHAAYEELKKYYKKEFSKKAAVTPKRSIFLSVETGAEYHPYFGYYYGDGLFDFYFLPTPHKMGRHFPPYSHFSPQWGWREDGHPDKGVGCIPSGSYERCAGGGGMNQFGPDEFGFQGFSKSAVIKAVREIVKEHTPGPISKAEMNRRVDEIINKLPVKYFYAPNALPKGRLTITQDMFVKVRDKLVEHCLQTFAIPMWLKPEKPLDEMTMHDLMREHRLFQAWGAQITLEIYRRAGYGQTRFMLFSSEDDNNLFYSIDWGVFESNRTPKPAAYAVKKAYQPVLASSRILSNKPMPGEPWMNGLWLNNDTYSQLKNVSIEIILKDSKDRTIKQSELSGVTIEPYQILNLSANVPDKFKQINPDRKCGVYTLMLDVTRNGRAISHNSYRMEVLPNNLTKGLTKEEKAKAEAILKPELAKLEKHFSDDLNISVNDSDNWLSTITRLRRIRVAGWPRWKRTLQNRPELLIDYPEFTPYVGGLIDAVYKMDKVKENLNKISGDKKNDSAAIKLIKKRLITARREYFKALDKTRKTIDLDEKALNILIGHRGVRIPVPLFYGKEITNDKWFEKTIKKLEKAGADKTAMRLRKLYNTKAGHWFDREIKTLKALRTTVK